ncbi:GGDEF domain-containing protein [Acinetobacter sp. S40]|uniref:GGDEF domain-containing protein n=1 Tax=unclassified Acinetobacter TaxID=196816 RepID=UPI00190DC9B5|nr:MULTISPECIES: GGDEF domain-containing protein [unclassified Acinetobacter]MBJ9983938.1 GGDEF domain-containing protein [Acinetobacter sp. S40]MBK0063529.1 GGDEF domain-containing protein [Acinetobacter sp. S55]MBK0065400.1 GGDEF domain-containing protein [Acinetobacter sp. S54]
MKKRLIKAIFEDNVVMNWTTMQKCTLILFLACGIHITWIVWKVYIFLKPELWPLINRSLLKVSLGIDILGFCLLALLIYPTLYYREHKWFEAVIPWLSVGLFTVTLCAGSYSIGTLSPATMVGYVSIVGVGLILFQRHFIYVVMIPASIMLLGSTYLSMKHIIPYAPLFNFGHLGIDAFTHPFWVASMIFFSAPIFLTCLLLFEILLTQWRNREEYIQRLSQIDPLTNILNRRSINRCLQELHLQHLDPKSGYAIILLDLDHFKQINDHYGHHIGDEVLIEVANCLSNHLRRQDYIGRFGGEEFILLLPHTPLEQAKIIAERCRLAIQKLNILVDHQNEIRISASFGIATSQYNCDPKEILNQADQALYAVKAMGRNQVQCFFDLPPRLS